MQATPLGVAAEKGHTGVVDMLVANGANVNHVNAVSIFVIYTLPIIFTVTLLISLKHIKVVCTLLVHSLTILFFYKQITLLLVKVCVAKIHQLNYVGKQFSKKYNIKYIYVRSYVVCQKSYCCLKAIILSMHGNPK